MLRSLRQPLVALLTALIIAPVLFSVQATSQTRANDDVLNRLRATYASLDGLQATFTQRVGNATLEGTIILSGDRYRLEAGDQTLVTDGTTAWAYSRSDNQVLVNHHIDDVTAFTPSTFFTEYPDRFRVEVTGQETLNGVRHDVLRLTPREADLNVREVTLFVRNTDALPTRVRLVDAGGSAMEFQLRDIQKNPRLTPDTFRFTPPAGAEVIDMR